MTTPGPLTFRDAVPEDVPAVHALLAAAALPADDVSYARQILLGAWDGATLVGVVGLEAHGPDALLRSLAVAEPWRGRGLGHALCERAVARARALRVRDLFLLTTTAEAFFARRGFARVDRGAVPAAVRASSQFSGGCCATAACMSRRIASAQPRPL